MTAFLVADTASSSGGGWILVVLAVVAFLEDSVGLGLVLPVETVVASSAATAAHGRVNIWAVLVVTWVFGSAGDMVGFAVGRRWGRRLLERFGGRFGMTPERTEEADAFITKWGALGVVGGRLIPAVRILVMPTAGASSMSWQRFVVADVVGVGLWASIHVTVGYMIGRGLSADSPSAWLLLGAAALLVVAVSGGGWLVHRGHRAA